MRREEFNRLTEHNQLNDWATGVATVRREKATGVDEYLKLIQQVVEKQNERERLDKSAQDWGLGGRCLCHFGMIIRLLHHRLRAVRGPAAAPVS